MAAEPDDVAAPAQSAARGNGRGDEVEQLRERVRQLEAHVRRDEERRRALIHIMGDLNESNKRLGDQRKAMLHILQDSHRSNQRLEDSRKAMIHIMDDLRETTTEMERREQELRDKQEQLVQAGKLATLGELTTGIAHELNNPLNNIGLFVGNVIDQLELGVEEADKATIVHELERALEQVRKATEIISHLRTFGRAASVNLERVAVDDVIERSLSLMNEQLRLRQIVVELELAASDAVVRGNPIQLEQVFVNLLANARDALADAPSRIIRVASSVGSDLVSVSLADTGPGIPPDLQQRIFDPFFTTKEVGAGTGLGLSITYAIIKEHGGMISVESPPGEGASFLVELPLADETPADEAAP